MRGQQLLGRRLRGNRRCDRGFFQRWYSIHIDPISAATKPYVPRTRTNGRLPDTATHGDPKTKTINGVLGGVITAAPGCFEIWEIGNLGSDAYFDLALDGHTFWLIESTVTCSSMRTGHDGQRARPRPLGHSSARPVQNSFREYNRVVDHRGRRLARIREMRVKW